MRPQQKPNRTRGRGNRKSNGNNVNRVYDSSGPEGKVRGTPQQIIDKYLSLARDAQTAGDRVTAENFLQHAEHYQRILILANAQSPDRRDHANGDYDDDPRGDGGHDDAPAASHSQPQGNGQSQQPSRRRDADRQESSERQAPTEPEMSGLTTIDPDGDGEDSLIVGAEEVAASQPAPARRKRGRPPKAAAQSEGDPVGAESGESPAESH